MKAGLDGEGHYASNETSHSDVSNMEVGFWADIKSAVSSHSFLVRTVSTCITTNIQIQVETLSTYIVRLDSPRDILDLVLSQIQCRHKYDVTSDKSVMAARAVMSGNWDYWLVIYIGWTQWWIGV